MAFRRLIWSTDGRVRSLREIAHIAFFFMSVRRNIAHGFSFSETGISHHEVPKCEVCNNDTYCLACKVCGIRLCSVCVADGFGCMCVYGITPDADNKDNAVYSAYEYHEEDKILMTSVRGKQRLGLVVDLGAARGLGGTDTVREICEHLLWPKGQNITLKNSASGTQAATRSLRRELA